MKGVVLAGGTGSRLHPLTKSMNKHLLPVHGKPMIYYPIQTLLKSGVDEILIVIDKKNLNDFKNALSMGELSNLNYCLDFQEGALGIAHALSLAKDFSNKDEILMILGDNIFEKSLDVKDFRGGARVFLREVDDPHRFGVANFTDGRISAIVEKPRNPTSKHAVTGAYLYDYSVFEKIESLEYSHRGELEITDVNNAFIQENSLDFRLIDGFWVDAGTIDTLNYADEHLKKSGHNWLFETI